MNFQEQENWDSQSSNDDGNFTVSSELIGGARTMRPSILNKSSMHSVTVSGNLMNQMPEIPPNTQRLDLTHNFITKFPLHLASLKEIRLTHNLIERIPQEINDIASLTIVRVSHNKIATLPFLKYVRHLELCHNPVKVITTRLSETCLQFLSFDWIPFLIDSSFHESERDIISNLCDLISKTQDDPLNQFVDFHSLFMHKNTTHSLVYSLHKAIMKGYDFFIAYMRDYHSNINFNQLIFLDTPLLQEALEEPYPFAIELFMLRKANLSSKPVYMMNLLLACQYSHLELFNFVVGLKRSLLIENHQQIIDTILKHFVPTGDSSIILKKVLKYCNFSIENPKVFRIPHRYNAIFADAISQAILYILQDSTLKQLFDFTQACNSSKQPLLHFAVNNRKPVLVKQILSHFSSQFIKNQNGKSAKYIRGSAICRKMIWKKQKLYIQEMVKKVQKGQIIENEKSTKQKEKWLKIIFSPQVTPRKKSQLEEFTQTPLMGRKIDLIIKSNRQRRKLKELGKNRKVQAMSDGLNICKKDKTGIIADVYLSKEDYGEIECEKYLDQECNKLTLYEAFRKSEYKTLKHDYSQISVKKQSISSFFQSPLNLCRDVEEIENEAQKQFIILKGKPKQVYESESFSQERRSSAWSSPQTAFV